eukprot:scaffold1503_cov250-Pinguiococcus_pyrenoidosus.AAC.2
MEVLPRPLSWDLPSVIVAVGRVLEGVAGAWRAGQSRKLSGPLWSKKIASTKGFSKHSSRWGKGAAQEEAGALRISKPPKHQSGLPEEASSYHRP